MAACVKDNYINCLPPTVEISQRQQKLVCRFIAFHQKFYVYQTTDPVVLVGGHRCELGLREDKSFEVLCCLPVLGGGVDVDHVKPRLVPVHRV